MADEIAKARLRPGFMERLAERLRDDKRILDRLGDQPCPAVEHGPFMRTNATWLGCGLVEGHDGDHLFHVRWVRSGRAHGSES